MNLKDFGAGFSFGMLARTMVSKLFKRIAEAANGVFRATVTNLRAQFNESVKTGKFDMKTSIQESKDTYRSGSEIRNWAKAYYNTNKYNGPLLQGHLYVFDYPDPLTKDRLAFYDTSPLALSFGLYHAKTGNLIEYAVNLHLLPSEIREAFITDIFELFKKRFKGEMYSEDPRAINEFNWQILQTFVDKYYIDFAVRSYIPSRRRNTMYIDYPDWPKALLLPSKGFVGVDDRQLIRLYRLHKAKVRRK
jgi:hypothetical protein